MTEQSSYQRKVNAAKESINNVSPSFCIAKWKQVTIHLQNGHTHSCHHPNTHVVPLSEIQKNPTALHNTEFKKSQRKLMLEGKRPEECSYCWKAEDAGDQLSDRIYKSAEPWALPNLDSIVSKSWDDNVDPSYVEVSFSSVCNFKCSYCSPSVSSKWMEEIVQHGPYQTSTQFNNIQWLKSEEKMPIPEKDDNPYVDAFWKWWPTMYPQLQHFRITGGEPLLSKHTFKVLDYIIENPIPNPELRLGINTNLNPPDELIDKFIKKLQIIQERQLVKVIDVYTSAESHGDQAEYIRYGMNYNKWLSNVDRIITEVPEVRVGLMSTYNVLSIPKYKMFLEDILKIRRKHNEKSIKNGRSVITVDTPYLRYPEHQSAFIITEDLVPYIEEQLQFMESNREPTSGSYIPFNGFHDHEIYKLKRIYNMVIDELRNPANKLLLQRKDFITFVDEHDRRRNTSFLKTFPELANMYNSWKSL